MDDLVQHKKTKTMMKTVVAAKGCRSALGFFYLVLCVEIRDIQILYDVYFSLLQCAQQ